MLRTMLAAALVALTTLGAPADAEARPHHHGWRPATPPAPVLVVRPARPHHGYVWVAGHWN